MFTGLAEAIKIVVGKAILITFLFVVLIAFVTWAKDHPDTASALFTKVADTLAALVVWGCNLIQKLVASPS